MLPASCYTLPSGGLSLTLMPAGIQPHVQPLRAPCPHAVPTKGPCLLSLLGFFTNFLSTWNALLPFFSYSTLSVGLNSGVPSTRKPSLITPWAGLGVRSLHPCYLLLRSIFVQVTLDCNRPLSGQFSLQCAE